jgi:Fic family protein
MSAAAARAILSCVPPPRIDYARSYLFRDPMIRLLDGFEGKLTSSKWAKLEKCSPDTALRDITELVNLGILKKDAAGGRSTSYSLVSDRA